MVFSLYFPKLKPWVLRSVTPQLILPAYLCTNFRVPDPPTPSSNTHNPLPCHTFSLSSCPPPPLLPIWMSIFFISLVVGVPCSLIFWQFQLFFILNSLLAFFWLREEAKHFYLCLHLGHNSKSKSWFLFLQHESVDMHSSCILFKG